MLLLIFCCQASEHRACQSQFSTSVVSRAAFLHALRSQPQLTAGVNCK
jgi:hypothetical protein